MPYFLPEPHLKTICYYGYYAWEKRDKEYFFETKTWIKGINNSFNKNPVECPRCSKTMELTIIYSSWADTIISQLWKTHDLYKGYFYLKAADP